MPTRETSSTPHSPDGRGSTASAKSSPGKDGLEKVELSDLDSSPPPPPHALPVEGDLMQLARLGELRAIQKLFDSGRYNARSTDPEGITALHWAAINGHYALCHFLLSAGADVNARGGDAMATPVLWASKRCHLRIVSLLLQHGADPLIRDDQGYNLLHSATLDGNTFQLSLMLHQPDIPVDVPDPQGHTSLMWAAYKGFPQCVELLLRWGADVHATDEMGFTALHWALVKGNYACIQRLVEYGSDRFAKSKPPPDPSNPQGQASEGDTPAMTAAKMNATRQWKRALVDSGFDENGDPLTFPVPWVKDRRWFINRFFFLWPFALGGLQLHMLASLPIYFAVPGVLIVGFALQYLAQQLLRWAPSDMKHMHRTPFLAGIFAGSLFWVGVQYGFYILPTTFWSHLGLNLAFLISYSLVTYFYAIAMTEDPGFIPKASSRGQTKKAMDELIEANAFDEAHFCTGCMIRKPLRSKHCRRCMRCVAREDHHCPWIDNCVGINNHKHFVLYVVSLIAGLLLLIPMTASYIYALPEPSTFKCTFLSDEYCQQYSKDPMTIITTGWGCLQLTWVFMLLFVHLTQIARAMTTYESMKGQTDSSAVTTFITTGSTTMDGANVNNNADAGSTPVAAGSTPHAHGKAKTKEGCLSQWYKILGMDTFFAIAFQGYKGRGQIERRKKSNPFTRGVFRNCSDFWTDGPVFGHKESGMGMLGGQRVDYTALYEVPREMRYRGDGYQEVANVDDDV